MERLLSVILSKKASADLEILLEEQLPRCGCCGGEFDEWVVSSSVDCIKAWSLYTTRNRLGNNKYINVEVVIPFASPFDLTVSFQDNTIDVREFVQKEMIDRMVYEIMLNMIAEIHKKIAEIVSRFEGERRVNLMF